MTAGIEKSKTKLKKKRIEKPFFYLFSKTFTSGARLTPTKWLAFCKICFIHVGCWGTLLLSPAFPGQWCALMCMFLVLLSTIYMYFLWKQPLIYSHHLVTNVLPQLFKTKWKYFQISLNIFIDIVNPLLAPPPPSYSEDPLSIKHPPLPFPLILHNQINKW